MFDSRMIMSTHIKNPVSESLRRFQDYDTCHLILLRAVLRVDYANGLLLRSNGTDIQRQQIQNWSAKIICRATKYDHATNAFTGYAGCLSERGSISRLMYA